MLEGPVDHRGGARWEPRADVAAAAASSADRSVAYGYANDGGIVVRRDVEPSDSCGRAARRRDGGMLSVSPSPRGLRGSVHVAASPGSAGVAKGSVTTSEWRAQLHENDIMSIIGYRHESQQGVRSRPRREAVAHVLACLDGSDAQTATPSDASKVYTLVLNGSTVRSSLARDDVVGAADPA